MPGISSALSRAALALLGAIALAIGARFGYDSYLSEKALERCITGGPCTTNINTLALQSAYQSARANVLLGGALAFLGIVVLMYSFLFAGRSSARRIIETDSE